MKALLLDDQPHLADLPTPRPSDDEARIRVRVAGVCDTDLQLVKGYMGYRGVLGHEFVGEVVEAPGADGAAWTGRRVVGDINAGCGVCDDCRLRDGHHCSQRSVLGIAGRDGALAEELALPMRNLVAVPDSVSDDAAVFAEPLAAALHVVEELPDDVRRGDCDAPVVVLGDGKLGLLIALALAGAGVRTAVVGHHAAKLARVAGSGVETWFEDDLDGPATAVPAASVPLVVEATGSAGGLARALSLVRPRGTVILKTTVAGATSMDLSPVVIHELRLVGSRCGSMQAAINALASGQVDPTPLIDARYALADAEAALARAAERGTMKVLVDVASE